jgi:hypothetical protein
MQDVSASSTKDGEGTDRAEGRIFNLGHIGIGGRQHDCSSGETVGSIFDFPADVDLSTALPAEALFRASGLSRRASLVLVGLGYETIDGLRSAALIDDPACLSARLYEAKHCGPAIVEEIERWLTISANH